MKEIVDALPRGQQARVAAEIGVSPAFLSNVLSDSPPGIAGRSVEKFAKYLKFPSAKAMRLKAYEQYRAAQPEWQRNDAGLREALNDLQQLLAAISHSEWSAMLMRFAHGDFAGRSKDFWTQTLTREALEDRRRSADAPSGPDGKSRVRLIRT